MKLRVLQWGIMPDYTGGPVSSQGSLSEGGGRVRESDVRTEAEVRVMRPQTKEYRLSLEAGKSKGMISFLNTES